MATTGQTSFKIGLAVYTQYRRVTDRQTDGETDKARRQRPRYAERQAGKSVDRIDTGEGNILYMSRS